MVIIGLTIFLSILAVIYGHYSFRRNINALFSLKSSWVIAFDLFTIFSFFFRLLYFFQNNLTHHFVFSILNQLSLILLGLTGFLMSLLVFLDVLEFFSKKAVAVNEDRRNFLKKSLTLSGIGISTLATGKALSDSYSPEIHKTLIPLPKDFSHLDGMTIVQLSDLHIGPSLNKEFMSMVVEKVNALNPDIVVITGDLIDGTPEFLKDDLTPLKNIKSKLGNYYVTGNHEYYWGGIIWNEVVRELGFIPLMNEHVIISDQNKIFALAGVSDYSSLRYNQPHTYDPRKAAKGIPDDLYKVLLSHQPKVHTDAKSAGFHLQLSGHTHAGQGFPWNLLVKIAYPYIQGPYDLEGIYLYVNGGTGFWGPPNRLGIAGEISHLTLSAFS